jgi:uncharacterized membrane protein (DUF106 family)
LNENPDSAKSLRTEASPQRIGTVGSRLKDVSASQTIDLDEGTVEDLKSIEQLTEMEKEVRRRTDEDKLRKRTEEIKKAQEDSSAMLKLPSKVCPWVKAWV